MFDQKYQDWNQKRIKGILEFYGHKFLYYKKILDLGCGHADISGVFYRLGADVTAVDARQEHLKVVSKKYNGIKVVKADLDIEWPFARSHFDIVLDLDLLCHLNNYEEHIRKICSVTNHLILETAVCDSPDPYKVILFPENKSIYDSSVNGVGSRPTAAAIERILTECGMNFRRQDNNRYNCGSYVYDWTNQNNEECDINKRRLWFAVKNTNHIQFAPPTIASPIIPSKKNESQSIAPIQNSHISIAKPLVNKLISNNYIDNRPSNDLKSDLKVAVCISGHMRTFEKTYASFKNNILGPYQNNCDTFIHTWETIGSPQSKEGSDLPVSNTKTELFLPKINEIISPKVINIENYDVYQTILADMDKKAKLTEDDKRGLHNNSLISYGSMLYSMNQVKNIVEKYENDNNIKYDVLIRLRTDLYFSQKYNIWNYQFGSLHVPEAGAYYQQGMNDQFAIGNNRIVKIYLSLFEHILSYINSRACLMRPEVFLKHHLSKNGVLIREHPLQFHIVRPNNRIVTQTKMSQQWTK